MDHSTTPINSVLPNEVDAFKMKAISLLQEEQLSFPDILNILKNTPLEAEWNGDAELHIRQKIGEKYTVTGSFQRDPHSQNFSIPIAHSFRLLREVKETCS